MLEVSGPTPGIVISKRERSSSLACCFTSASNALQALRKLSSDTTSASKPAVAPLLNPAIASLMRGINAILFAGPNTTPCILSKPRMVDSNPAICVINCRRDANNIRLSQAASLLT
jgi:hypothetical protein